jgi:hypothetical protein
MKSFASVLIFFISPSFAVADDTTKLLELAKLSFACPSEPLEMNAVTRMVDSFEFRGDARTFRVHTKTVFLSADDDAALSEDSLESVESAAFSQLAPFAPYNGHLRALCKAGKQCISVRRRGETTQVVAHDFLLCDKATIDAAVTALNAILKAGSVAR